MDFHVFEAGHWSTVVEVSQIKGTEEGVGRRDGAVDQNFGGGKAGGLSGCWTWKIKAIASGAVAYSVGFGFGGTNGCFLLAIRHLAPSWDVSVFDEENGVGALDSFFGGSAFSDSLSEHTEVVRHTTHDLSTADLGTTEDVRTVCI